MAKKSTVKRHSRKTSKGRTDVKRHERSKTSKYSTLKIGEDGEPIQGSLDVDKLKQLSEDFLDEVTAELNRIFKSPGNPPPR